MKYTKYFWIYQIKMPECRWHILTPAIVEMSTVYINVIDETALFKLI
jgi:hypothetical protein